MLAELLRELEQKDPVTFQKIDRRNPRRIVRAVEVIRLTGRPFSAQRAAWTPGAASLGPGGPPCYFGLARTTADLRARIDARVEEMFARGLVAETELLLQRGLAANRTAMQAIGYRQVAEHLRGERSLAETVELVKIRTRQFAKRQLTPAHLVSPTRKSDLGECNFPGKRNGRGHADCRTLPELVIWSCARSSCWLARESVASCQQFLGFSALDRDRAHDIVLWSDFAPAWLGAQIGYHRIGPFTFSREQYEDVLHTGRAFCRDLQSTG